MEDKTTIQDDAKRLSFEKDFIQYIEFRCVRVEDYEGITNYYVFSLDDIQDIETHILPIIKEFENDEIYYFGRVFVWSDRKSHGFTFACKWGMYSCYLKD